MLIEGTCVGARGVDYTPQRQSNGAVATWQNWLDGEFMLKL